MRTRNLHLLAVMSRRQIHHTDGLYRLCNRYLFLSINNSSSNSSSSYNNSNSNSVLPVW
jgi:hypothetical protein